MNKDYILGHENLISQNTISIKDTLLNYTDWYKIFSVIHKRNRVGTIDGIKIYVYSGEDNGKHKYPHLHAYYSGKEIVVRIDNGECIEGEIDKNKRRILRKWINEHQTLIKEKWNELNNGIIIPVI